LAAGARWLPYLALGFAVLALGFSAIFVKWANVPGAVSGFYRVALAAAVMTVPVAPRARREWPWPRQAAWLAALAGIFFAGDLASWNTAVLITNAANATLFGNTAPLWVGLGALLLFKEKLRPVFWAGMLLAMIGAAVILGSDFLTHPRLGVGDLLALLAGLFYGAFMLATQRARQGLSAMTSWWISAVTSSAALLLVGLLLQQPLTGYPLASYLSLLALALVTQAGGYLAINYALGHLSASLVSPTLLGQPVLTAILAMPLLGEPLLPAQIVGGLMVLAGIWLVHRQADDGPRAIGRSAAARGAGLGQRSPHEG
jgi:drug/metabolite transporter (DMT)-like permease